MMKLIKKVWVFIGTSGAWLLLFIGAMIGDVVSGQTLIGMFYVFICLHGFFLCRIAESIEAKNNRIETDIVHDLQFKDGKPVTHQDT